MCRYLVLQSDSTVRNRQRSLHRWGWETRGQWRRFLPVQDDIVRDTTEGCHGGHAHWFQSTRSSTGGCGGSIRQGQQTEAPSEGTVTALMNVVFSYRHLMLINITVFCRCKVWVYVCAPARACIITINNCINISRVTI